MCLIWKPWYSHHHLKYMFSDKCSHFNSRCCCTPSGPGQKNKLKSLSHWRRHLWEVSATTSHRDLSETRRDPSATSGRRCSCFPDNYSVWKLRWGLQDLFSVHRLLSERSDSHRDVVETSSIVLREVVNVVLSAQLRSHWKFPGTSGEIKHVSTPSRWRHFISRRR